MRRLNKMRSGSYWLDDDITEEPESRKQKELELQAERNRLRQIRIEQEERLLAVREERNRLRKQTIAMEKADRRARKIKKFLSFPIHLVKWGAMTASALLMLRQLAQYDPYAASFYMSIMNTLRGCFRAASRGSKAAVEKAKEALDKLISFLHRRK